MSKDNSDFFKAKNEWSKIKDKLLGCYLTPYFQKVLVGLPDAPKQQQLESADPQSA